MPPMTPFRRTPRPAWPVQTIVAASVVAVGAVVAALSFGGFWYGLLTLPLAIVAWVLTAWFCLTRLRAPVYADYLRALELLREYPGDVELQQLALEIGREYASLTFDLSGKPTYTETAIQNDIAAASGGKDTRPPPEQAP